MPASLPWNHWAHCSVLAGPSSEEQTNCLSDIPLKLPFGIAFGLKIKLIEYFGISARHQAGWSCSTSWSKWHTEASYGTKQVWPKQSAVPGNRRTPVVAYHHGLLISDRIYQSDDIANQMKKRILIDGVGTIRLSVTPHVRSNNVVASFG